MHTKNSKALAKCIVFVTCMMSAISLAGCASATEEDDKVIIVEQETAPAEYTMVVAKIDDVVKTKRVTSYYRQMHDEELSFTVSGRMVSNVYVEEGDSVKKGQLLAELEDNNATQRMEDLEYRIAKNQLTLDYLELNRDYEVSMLWLQGQGYRGESVMRSYEQRKEDCEDTLMLDRMELEGIKADMGISKLYAGMDGTVSFVKNRLKGSTSTKEEMVIKIIDTTACLFEVEDMTYAQYFTPETVTNLTISSGTGAGSYTVVPYEMDKWEDVMYFTLTGEGEDASIEVDAMGTLMVVTAYKEQVLTLPTESVHKAGEEYFVYVMGDGGVREVKWIEIGLQGDKTVEVTSGLEEGDRVIQR